MFRRVLVSRTSLKKQLFILHSLYPRCCWSGEGRTLRGWFLSMNISYIYSIISFLCIPDHKQIYFHWKLTSNLSFFFTNDFCWSIYHKLQHFTKAVFTQTWPEIYSLTFEVYCIRIYSKSINVVLQSWTSLWACWPFQSDSSQSLAKLYWNYAKITDTLQWRHIECDGVSNHQPPDCLLNRLFKHRSKKTS